MRTQFDFYGYNSPTSGKYYYNDDEYFIGEDYRNEERYREYKDVGFTMLLLQHENSYDGEDFETSSCNLCMTEAVKAGIDRIIVGDKRLVALCREPVLVGEEGRFKTQEELDEYVKFCVAPYVNKAGFYGIQLLDEPRWQQIASYGLVCRTLKKFYPDMYLQTNLLCIDSPDKLSPTTTEPFKAYEEYLDNFLKASGQDCVQFDDYPFRRSYIIGGYSLRCFQIVAKLCKERNLEFRTVLQTFCGFTEGRILFRRVTEADVYWHANLAMGCGCVEYSFFTYFTKQKIISKDKAITTDGVDGAAMINLDGTRTKMYYYVQRMIAEMKLFAPVILKYKYDNNYLFFEEGKTNTDFMQTEFAIYNKNCPIDVKVSKGVVFVTHLKKEGGDMFMVENISNIKDQFDTGEIMQIEVTLPTEENTASYYYRGVRRTVGLSGGKFSMPLACGDAIFIEL